jgi:hypothetical protein
MSLLHGGEKRWEEDGCHRKSVPRRRAGQHRGCGALRDGSDERVEGDAAKENGTELVRASQRVGVRIRLYRTAIRRTRCAMAVMQKECRRYCAGGGVDAVTLTELRQRLPRHIRGGLRSVHGFRTTLRARMRGRRHGLQK